MTTRSQKLPYDEIDGVAISSYRQMRETQRRTLEVRLEDDTVVYVCIACGNIYTTFNAVKRHIKTHIVSRDAYAETLRRLMQLFTDERLPASDVADTLNRAGRLTRTGIKWTPANAYMKYQRFAPRFNEDPLLRNARHQRYVNELNGAAGAEAQSAEPVNAASQPVDDPVDVDDDARERVSDITAALEELHERVVGGIDELRRVLDRTAEHPAVILELISRVSKLSNADRVDVSADELRELRRKAKMFEEITAIARDN